MNGELEVQDHQTAVKLFKRHAKHYETNQNSLYRPERRRLQDTLPGLEFTNSGDNITPKPTNDAEPESKFPVPDF